MVGGIDEVQRLDDTTQALVPAPNDVATGQVTRIPALDGLRGLAVGAVIAFHMGLGWAKGGFLGVDTFFVLSGYLITSLLIAEWRRTATISLSRFWSRRARRLLPALLTVLVAIAVWTAVVGVPDPASLRLDAIAGLVYAANWRFIIGHQGYFAQFGQPSLVLHTWSLAIEEQFYLVWPLVALPVLCRFGVRALRNVALAGAAASSALLIVLYHRGASTSRLYYGTDTRVQAVLIGAALAAWLAGRPTREGAARTARRLSATALAVLGAGFTLWAWHALDGGRPFVYNGGLTVAALATAAVIIGSLDPTGVLARGLSWRPLRATGLISYELYLWHWPVLLVLTAGRTGLNGASLLALRLVVIVALSIATWALVERPFRMPASRHAAPGRYRPVLAVVALGAAVAIVATIGMGASPAQQLAAPRIDPSRVVQAPSPSSPSTPPSARGAATAAAPVAPVAPAKVLLLGDSVALTLGKGLDNAAPTYGVDLYDEGIVGCGILGDASLRVNGVPAPPGHRCASWEDQWRAHITSVHPDVVAILVGRWEVFDRQVGQRWEYLGQPDFDAFVSAQLDRAIAVAEEAGGRVALLTAPHFAGSERPDGGRWPEDDPARVDRFNQLLRAAALRHADRVEVLDVAAALEPGGRFVDRIGDVTVRSPDRIHVSVAGGELVATTLLPELVRLGHLPPPGVAGATDDMSGTALPATVPPARTRSGPGPV
ncbi:MAG: acyltransferase family protein [Acidimicrobiales bacterium]